jgi:hypothetical protein
MVAETRQDREIRKHCDLILPYLIGAILALSLHVSVFGQTVYKTPTGKKYHTSGHYANSSAISLSDALKLGLEPCAVCKPSPTNANSLVGDANGQVVYKTKTGSKYHKAGHYESSTAISLSEALKLGLEPCAICKPQGNNTSPTGATPLVSEPKSTPAKTTTSRQCRGTTKAGQRCKRMTTDASGYCYQHK